MRTSGKGFPRQFKRGYRISSGDRGESIEKGIEAVACLKEVKEVFQGHPRPSENRGAAQNVLMALNNIPSI